MAADLDTPAGPRPIHPRLTIMALDPADRDQVAKKYAPPEITALDDRIRVARNAAQIARHKFAQLDAELARLRPLANAVSVEELNQVESALSAARVAEEAARRDQEHLASGVDDKTAVAYRDLLARRDTVRDTVARPELPATGPVRTALEAVHLAFTKERRSDPMALAILDRWRRATAARDAFVDSNAATWADPSALVTAEERRQCAADDVVDARKAIVRRNQRVARAEEELAAADAALEALRGRNDWESGPRLAALVAEVDACRAATVELVGHDPGDALEHCLATRMVAPQADLAALRRALSAAGAAELAPRWNSVSELEVIESWCRNVDRERTVRVALAAELADLNARLVWAAAAHDAGAESALDTAARLVDAGQALVEARRHRERIELMLADLRARATGDGSEAHEKARADLSAAEIAWPAAAAVVVRADKAAAALVSERHSAIDRLLREDPFGSLVLNEPGDGVASAHLPGLLTAIDARAERGPVVVLTSDPNVIVWADTQPAGRVGVAAQQYEHHGRAVHYK